MCRSQFNSAGAQAKGAEAGDKELSWSRVKEPKTKVQESKTKDKEPKTKYKESKIFFEDSKEIYQKVSNGIFLMIVNKSLSQPLSKVLSITDNPMSELPHIFYPGQGEEDTYFQSCRRFVTSKTSQKEWERLTRHLEMTYKGQEFIGKEFTRLLKDWYMPTEGLAPAEVKVHGGDARLVIGKVLEEFALMHAQYQLLASQHPLLVNDNSSKPVPGYDPGHTLGTGDQEPHNRTLLSLGIKQLCRLQDPLTVPGSLGIGQRPQANPHCLIRLMRVRGAWLSYCSSWAFPLT
ncbi:hypothetical protein DSO57_1037614 [Entomophthora muscae]|uniref:Uncharacterized protein n=1 Tax=Entomophthora muscae TaxID=34485 RepID=A0ACC2U912_9FUNG|nr:hypothetical protein DSO57_1037614 [Entomophthora muscae]